MYNPPFTITPKILNLVGDIMEVITIFENVPINDQKNDPKKRVNKILELIKENKFITIKELAHKLNVSEKTIKRDLDKLKKENILKRIGKKGGYWKIK